MNFTKILISKFTILLILLSFHCSQWLLERNIASYRSKANLQLKTIVVDKYTYPYLDNEATGKEAIVMLHGFAGNKDMWADFASHLQNKYRLVIPDLPGFGENNQYKEDSYGILDQVKRVKDFTEKLGLTKFHIIGNSMGGSIAGTFASEYPDKIITLGLFDNAGVNGTTKSEFSQKLEKGVNILLVKEEKDFDALLSLNFYKQPFIPFNVKTYLAKEAVKNSEFHQKIFFDLSKDFAILEPRLSKMNMPTIIIWGEDDKILDKSATEVLKKGLKNSKVEILKECGHTPMIEKPEDTAKLYLKFISSL